MQPFRDFFRYRGFTQQKRKLRKTKEEGMIRETLKWFLPVVLTGCFLTGPAVLARGQHELAPAGNRVDRRQDRRALRRDGRIDEAEAEYRQTLHGRQHSGNRGAGATPPAPTGALSTAATT